MSGKPQPHRRMNLVGRVFGGWTVLERSQNNKHGQSRWLCRCACGTESIVPGNNLTRGYSRSCGCLGRVVTGERRTTHGATRGGETPEYRTWCHMLSRCTNPREKSFARYGGRGIEVCQRWSGENGFALFLADVGPRPSPAHSIDRIDNAQGYSPDNCRWATTVEQANNKRNNRFFTHAGKTATLPQWSRDTGLPLTTLKGRLSLGWDVERMLTEPRSVIAYVEMRQKPVAQSPADRITG